MTTTFADIPVADLHQHPNNVRHDAIADQELIDSVKAVGILQALLVAPAADGDGYVVIGGHRRLDAASKAQLQTAPAVIREDLVTEAQQLEAMLIENGRRHDLTAVEEAEGYEQLELFGYKPKDIAKATGRTVGVVRDRLKLARLSTPARAALHDGQITIGDAEALSEFADDPEQMTELEAHLGTSNFKWKLEQARDEVVRRKKWRAMVVDFEKQGAKRVEWNGGRWDQEKGPVPLSWTFNADAAFHGACLGWTHSGNRWDDPKLICTRPDLHPQQETAASGPTLSGPASDHGVETAQEQQQRMDALREERMRKADERMAASRVRAGYMSEHFTGLLTTKTVPAALIDTLRVTVPSLLTGEAPLDSDAYMHLMGLEGDWYSTYAAHAADVAAGTPALVLKAYAAQLAGQMEADLTFDQDQVAVRAWAWLTGTGYQLSDIDIEIRDQAIAEDVA